GRATQKQVAKTIAETLEKTGYLLDPHTATGVFVAAKNARAASPMVTLATAHPAKFPDAVKSASGIDPTLPPWLAGMMQREERYEILDPDLAKVEAYIGSHSRIRG
ncbi:MAG TPA: threonine synthase, partial [Mycoplana sp.]|nr:threonine synthase [Mycoplana sp.]